MWAGRGCHPRPPGASVSTLSWSLPPLSPVSRQKPTRPGWSAALCRGARRRSGQVPGLPPHVGGVPGKPGHSRVHRAPPPERGPGKAEASRKLQLSPERATPSGWLIPAERQEAGHLRFCSLSPHPRQGPEAVPPADSGSLASPSCLPISRRQRVGRQARLGRPWGLCPLEPPPCLAAAVTGPACTPSYRPPRRPGRRRGRCRPPTG